MGNPERETIILINQQDREDGYFRFGTSEPLHLAKLCRRIGGQDKLLSLEKTTQKDGGVWWYNCKVPYQYLNPATLGVRGPKKVLTEKHLKALKERIKDAKRKAKT